MAACPYWTCIELARIWEIEHERSTARIEKMGEKSWRLTVKRRRAGVYINGFNTRTEAADEGLYQLGLAPQGKYQSFGRPRDGKAVA